MVCFVQNQHLLLPLGGLKLHDDVFDGIFPRFQCLKIQENSSFMFILSQKQRHSGIQDQKFQCKLLTENVISTNLKSIISRVPFYFATLELRVEVISGSFRQKLLHKSHLPNCDNSPS